jgi:hypothetical protein
MKTDSQSVSSMSLLQKLMAWPSTALGRGSLWLLAGFIALMGLFAATMTLYGGVDEVRRLSIQAGGRFFSLPWIASTLVAAFASAIAAGGAALVAIIRKGERSIAMVLPVFMGAIVLLFSNGELLEGR